MYLCVRAHASVWELLNLLQSENEFLYLKICTVTRFQTSSFNSMTVALTSSVLLFFCFVMPLI